MDLGAAFGSSLAYEGAFGATLEALCDYFWYIRMTSGHFRITLGSLWNHFGCIGVGFQKTHTFPQQILMILQNSGVSLGFGVRG